MDNTTASNNTVSPVIDSTPVTAPVAKPAPVERQSLIEAEIERRTLEANKETERRIREAVIKEQYAAEVKALCLTAPTLQDLFTTVLSREQLFKDYVMSGSINELFGPRFAGKLLGSSVTNTAAAPKNTNVASGVNVTREEVINVLNAATTPETIGNIAKAVGASRNPAIEVQSGDVKPVLDSLMATSDVVTEGQRRGMRYALKSRNLIAAPNAPTVETASAPVVASAPVSAPAVPAAPVLPSEPVAAPMSPEDTNAVNAIFERLAASHNAPESEPLPNDETAPATPETATESSSDLVNSLADL